MECVEGALKNSFIGQKNNNPHHHNPLSFSDDFTTVVSGDDFFVDGFLDFSDDGDFEEHNDDTHFLNDSNSDKILSISPVNTVNDETNPSFSMPEPTDLCLPAEDVADLEWVSRFVDDSFSGGYSLTCPAGKLPEKKRDPEPDVKPSLTTPVLTKARSKRTRTGGRVWSLGSNPLTDSSTSSSSSSSCTTSNAWRFFQDSTQSAESIFGKKPVKRQKKTKKNSTPAAGEPAVQPRRCSHCLVQKTPQWRAGPLGAKTLCNACGVRFKSGRLLPEYRPACSPTFSSEVHSNNHRKVLEMRQKKEAVEPGLTLPVPSF